MTLLIRLQRLLDTTRSFDFMAPLALRIYLAPIFFLAGSNKLAHVQDVAAWFESLAIPAPELMAYLAGATELVGGIALLIGLGVRWIALPLMVIMTVAAATAHWDNGWHVLPEQELTVPWEWRSDLIEEAAQRKSAAREILREHGDYGWLTQTGGVTILKNGIEFAATYFVMLLALFFFGAGRFVSMDYWLRRALVGHPPSAHAAARG
jgi:putative oxidoreductase